MSTATETQISIIENPQTIVVFESNAVDKIIADAKAHAKSLAADVSTDKGRKELRSEAHKIAKLKTHLVELANKSVEAARKTVSEVTSERIRLEKGLDEARDEAKRPAIEWDEREEKRKAEISERIKQIREQGERMESLTLEELASRSNEVETLKTGFDFAEFADLSNDAATESLEAIAKAIVAREKYEADQAELKRLREAEEKRKADEAIAEEKRLAKKAEEDAKAREAEEVKARNKRNIGTLKAWADGRDAPLESLQSWLSSIATCLIAKETFGDLYDEAIAVRDLAKLKIEGQVAEIQAKAKSDQEASDAKAKADEESRIAKVIAYEVEAERVRVKAAADKLAAEQAEAKAKADALAANEKHRAKVRSEAAYDISNGEGISPELAGQIVLLIERNKARHLSITF